MKLIKFSAIMLVIIMLLSVGAVSVSAADSSLIQERFQKGKGPETNGFTIDYRYFSPVKENDSVKYPLVIWLHGMGDGEYEGKQVTTNDVYKWTEDEFQSRFKDSGGAFIFAPRSVEEKKLYWTDELVYPLRAAIDDFIEANKDNIDLKRIYVGGYSMGGKMTLKMAVAYPDMFAAIFPICPAWIPGDEAVAYLKDTPVWLTSGALDPLVNYYTYVMSTWDRIKNFSNVPQDCRLSTLFMTLHANGMPCQSSHWSWFSVNNDMFSSKGGNYPLMKTQNALGEKVELTYPEGMISWLSGYRSNFDGEKADGLHNAEALKTDGRPFGFDAVRVFFRNFISLWCYAIGLK